MKLWRGRGLCVAFSRWTQLQIFNFICVKIVHTINFLQKMTQFLPYYSEIYRYHYNYKCLIINVLYRRLHVDVLVCFLPVGLGHVIVGSTVKVWWWSICQQTQMLTWIQTWNCSHDINGFELGSVSWPGHTGLIGYNLLSNLLNNPRDEKELTFFIITDVQLRKHISLALKISKWGDCCLNSVPYRLKYLYQKQSSDMGYMIWTIWCQEHMVLVNILMVTWLFVRLVFG